MAIDPSVHLSSELKFRLYSKQKTGLYLHLKNLTGTVFRKRTFVNTEKSVFQLEGDPYETNIFAIRLVLNPEYYLTVKKGKLVFSKKIKNDDDKLFMVERAGDDLVDHVYIKFVKTDEYMVMNPNRSISFEKLGRHSPTSSFVFKDWSGAKKEFVPPSEVFWVKIANHLNDIAIGSPDILWGITTNGKVVRLDPTTGAFIKTDQPDVKYGKPIAIECAPDGTVICICGEGTVTKVLRYKALTVTTKDPFQGSWTELDNVSDFNRCAIGSYSQMYFLNKTNDLYYLPRIKSRPVLITNTLGFDNHSVKFTDIGASADGTIIGIGEDKKAYHINIKSNHDAFFDRILFNGKFKAISVASNSRVMGISEDNKILIHAYGTKIFNSVEIKELFFKSGSRKWVLRNIEGDILKMDHDATNTCYIIVKKKNQYFTYRRVSH